MARGKKTGGRDFKPGQVANPLGAGAGDPVMKAIRRLTHAQLAEVGCLIIEQNPEKLKDIMKDPASTSIKVWFAAICLKGIQKGDAHAMDVLMNRIVGKVKEKVDLTSSDGSMTPTFIFETKTSGKKD